MEEEFIVTAEGYEQKRLAAFAPEHAAELFADLVSANEGLLVHVRGEGLFRIQTRIDYYALRIEQ